MTRMLTAADVDLLAEFEERDEFFWLDLHDPPDALLEHVGEVLGFHPLAREDSREFGQRPKVEPYGEHLLLVFFGARVDGDGDPVPVEVHLYISGSFVVTLHRDRCRRLESVRALLESEQRAVEELVVYHVLDALTDSILEVLEGTEARVDAFQAAVVAKPRARDRDRMASLRPCLGALRRAIVTQRQVFPRTVEAIAALPGLEHDVGAYYRDVGDHLARAVDEVEGTRDALQGALDTYTNEVQEHLTIVATIFLPLTVVVGFFGQNFDWMIEHIGSGPAFWTLGVGGTILSGVAIVLWLRHRGFY